MQTKFNPNVLAKTINLKEKPWNYFQISNSPSQALLHVRSDIYLYSFDQVPAFQQDNKFITHGYRSYLSAKQCFKSVFVVSNELVNIWTHAGMVFLLLVLLIYDQTFMLPSMQTPISDHFMFLTFTISVQICMVCSTGYHIFNSHVHEKVAIRWYSFDLCGITLSMLGCYIIGLYYGFYCSNAVRHFYTAAIMMLMVISGALMLHPQYLTKEWSRCRLIHLTSLVVFAIFPTLHWVYVSPSYETKTYLPDVLLFYVILALAMCFYSSRFPERVWPGRFNLGGHSHNWWHVLINISFLYWRTVAYRLLQYRLETRCGSPPSFDNHIL